MKLRMSVCIPVYKGSTVLETALKSVAIQSYKPFEVVVCDDNPLEETLESMRTKKILKQVQDDKVGRLFNVRYIKNSKNLGSAKTIKKLAQLAKGDIIFFLCQDDILATDALQKVHDSFKNPAIGVVTRPFFWFEDDVQKPTRAVFPYSFKKDTVLSILNGEKQVKKIFESVGQISGLAYRKRCLTFPFTDDIFVGHIYPFAGILRKYKCVFLKDFTVAVGSKLSQTKHRPDIYRVSPTKQWVEMFEKVFHEERFKEARKAGIDQITTQAEGLIQIKCYAKEGVLQKEIKEMLRLNKSNYLSLKFWFYVCICLLLPTSWVVFINSLYKKFFHLTSSMHVENYLS